MSTITSRILAVMLLINLCVDAQSGEFLGPQNKVRAKVGVPALTWSDALATYALKYAKTQITQCRTLMHSSGGQYGENLFWGSAKTPEWSAGDAVKAWADEAKYYDYGKNSCMSGKVCGHYTQIVWRTTKEVGCAHTKCSDDSDYIICSYNPPGNRVGQKPY